MEYKKKIIIRIVLFSVAIIVGVALTIIEFMRPTSHSYGGVLTVLGVVEVVKYARILKNEDKLRDWEIREKDERIILMDRQANSMTIDIFAIAALVASIVLALMNYERESQIIMYVLCGLLLINIICREIVRRKY